MRLERSVETPLRYLIVVGWVTLEDHTIASRTSPDYQTWRNLVGGYFDGAPVVQHTESVVPGF